VSPYYVQPKGVSKLNQSHENTSDRCLKIKESRLDKVIVALVIFTLKIMEVIHPIWRVEVDQSHTHLVMTCYDSDFVLLLCPMK